MCKTLCSSIKELCFLRFSRFSLLLILSAMLGFSHADETVFVEGKHYTRVNPAVSVEVEDGKIEVREFFWYGCPHCYAIEPYIEKWEPPEDVVFVRMPALLGPAWVVHAYTYYSLEALDRLDLHSKIFDALHVSRLRLMEAGDMALFLEQYDVDTGEFRQAMESFQVKTRIKNAEVVASSYGLRSVPTIAVNGRYLVTTSQFSDYSDIINVVDFLVEKERERLNQTQEGESQTEEDEQMKEDEQTQEGEQTEEDESQTEKADA